jgi:hypothetical protein
MACPARELQSDHTRNGGRIGLPTRASSLRVAGIKPRRSRKNTEKIGFKMQNLERRISHNVDARVRNRDSAGHFISSRRVCGQLAGGLSGADPPIGGRFITTKPHFSRCRTIRCAAIEAIIASLSWTRFRPENSNAKATDSAMSLASAGVSFSSRSGMRHSGTERERAQACARR